MSKFRAIVGSFKEALGYTVPPTPMVVAHLVDVIARAHSEHVFDRILMSSEVGYLDSITSPRFGNDIDAEWLMLQHLVRATSKSELSFFKSSQLLDLLLVINPEAPLIIGTLNMENVFMSVESISYGLVTSNSPCYLNLSFIAGNQYSRQQREHVDNMEWSLRYNARS